MHPVIGRSKNRLIGFNIITLPVRPVNKEQENNMHVVSVLWARIFVFPTSLISRILQIAPSESKVLHLRHAFYKRIAPK